jgi:glycosyltransferase involved in cell wall biosynthesis
LTDRRRAAFVVPGGVETVTGGNVYDTYVIEALQRNDWDVSVIEPGGAEYGADVVVVDSLAFKYGAPRTDAPIIALVHQLPSEANQRPEWTGAEQETLSATSLVIVVAPHLRDAVAPMTGAPIEVILPGRDHAWAPEGSRLDGNTILCVANGVPGKGVPDAITAFGDAAIAGELVIVGDPEKNEDEAKRTRAAVSRHDAPIRFLGVATPDALSELYASARLYVTGSRYEGWPISVSEAMASGLPVVGYDAPGVRDLIRSGRDGVLVPTGNVVALSQIIGNLFRDRHLAAAMGNSARQRALAWPTWEETGDRFVRVLAKLVP